MRRPVVVDRAEDLSRLRAGAVEPLEAEMFRLTDPWRHLALKDARGGLVARCSLWRASDAEGELTTAGLVGHYAAADAAAGRELLEHASSWHREEGCERVIGPMDGSTWHRYRLVTERGTEPAFFLEPDHPDDWPRHFTDAGFVPLATYVSMLNLDISQVDPRSDRRRAELELAGITLRTIDIERFDDELAAIHQLSLAAFAGNFLYSPIGLETFAAFYGPILPHLVPELVLLAERDGLLVGLMFGMPDLMEPARGEPLRTVILKSLAVHPACAGDGLGTVLGDYCLRAARKLGFERAIHALMQEDSVSALMAVPYATVMRRYTLYEKSLGRRER